MIEKDRTVFTTLLVQKNQMKIISATNENMPLAYESPITYMLKLATLKKNLFLVRVRLLEFCE